MSEPERLQRALARAGFGSRRACEDLIRSGRVSIDGRVATLGDRVDPGTQVVTVNGARISVDPTLRYFALHKPLGVTTTLSDRHAERDLKEFLPDEVRVVPVGRLDRDSEGLLLLTNDGDLIERLTHPRYGIEKEYLAEVEGYPDERDLRRLLRGVELEDGPAMAVSARAVAASGARGAVRLVLTEGRKREVRRMLDAIGFPVVRLVRLRVGPIRLATLPAGERRELEPEEVTELYRVAGL